MDAGLSDQVKSSRLPDHARDTQSLRENFLQDLRVGCAGNQVPGAASVSYIRPFVANQFPAIRTKNPKLQPRPIAGEEDVFLMDRLRACAAQPNCHGLG